MVKPIDNNNSYGFDSIYTQVPHPGSGKLIEGWKWDQRWWPNGKELRLGSIINTNWDPDLSALPKSFFQSGYGHGDDLSFLQITKYMASGASFSDHRIQLKTGFYYINDTEYYLFSDDSLVEVLPTAISGHHSKILKYNPKPGYPIVVAYYFRDRSTGTTTYGMKARKKVNFTVSGTSPEFQAQVTGASTMIYTSTGWNPVVGSQVTVTNGWAPVTGLQVLDSIGLGTGNSNQSFLCSYFPLASGSPVYVYTYQGNTDASNNVPTIQWSGIPLSGIFLVSGYQCKVEYEIGRITFGNNGLQYVPDFGDRICVAYTVTPSVQYEPPYADSIASLGVTMGYGDMVTLERR